MSHKLSCYCKSRAPFIITLLIGYDNTSPSSHPPHGHCLLLRTKKHKKVSKIILIFFKLQRFMHRWFFFLHCKSQSNEWDDCNCGYLLKTFMFKTDPTHSVLASYLSHSTGRIQQDKQPKKIDCFPILKLKLIQNLSKNSKFVVTWYQSQGLTNLIVSP